MERSGLVSRRSVLRWAVLGGGAVVAAAVVGRLPETASASGDRVPFLLRCSDAVAPGGLVSVNGEWLDPATVEVWVAPAVPAPRRLPPAGSRQLTVVQIDPDGGHFVVAGLPSDLAAGVFELWVHNSAGWCSASLLLNGPRPLFMSEREAWAGQQITVAGRNLGPSEYGAHTLPQVRLVGQGNVHLHASVVDANPFAVTFEVPQGSAGSYHVQVSTDERVWVGLPDSDPLTLVPVGSDPLGLGVAWADHFRWDHTFDVTDYGVPTNSGGDVTTVVQAAVNTAKQAGGGVVYFPAGRYQMSQLLLPADIVLQGESQDTTTLAYTGSGPAGAGAFIQSDGDGTVSGHQGVARLTVTTVQAEAWPGTFISLGQSFSSAAHNKNLRTASEMFLKEAGVDYQLMARSNPPPAGTLRGIGAQFFGKERALCADSHFVGYFAMPYYSAISNYYTVTNNHFEYSTGQPLSYAARTFFENNRLIGHREYTSPADGNLHGLFCRDHCYVYNNTVDGMGTISSAISNDNDGEPLNVEAPSGYFNYGGVSSADSTSITVVPDQPLTDPLTDGGIYYAYLAVAIYDGTGLGQLRAVTAIDTTSNKITIGTAWDVTPDTSSVWSLILPIEAVTFYHNTVNDNTKGIWLYNNCFDGVIADNSSTDSEGAFISGVRSAGVLRGNCFNRITRNTITGVSPKSLHAGVSYNTGRFDRNGAAYGTLVYATEFLHNTIAGDPIAIPQAKTESPPVSGIVAYAASYSSLYDGNPDAPDARNTVIRGNALDELTQGVTITHSLDGTIIADNSYTSTVQTFLTDTGSLHTDTYNNQQV